MTGAPSQVVAIDLAAGGYSSVLGDGMIEKLARFCSYGGHGHLPSPESGGRHQRGGNSIAVEKLVMRRHENWRSLLDKIEARIGGRCGEIPPKIFAQEAVFAQEGDGAVAADNAVVAGAVVDGAPVPANEGAVAAANAVVDGAVPANGAVSPKSVLATSAASGIGLSENGGGGGGERGGLEDEGAVDGGDNRGVPEHRNKGAVLGNDAVSADDATLLAKSSSPNDQHHSHDIETISAASYLSEIGGLDYPYEATFYNRLVKTFPRVTRVRFFVAEEKRRDFAPPNQALQDQSEEARRRDLNLFLLDPSTKKPIAWPHVTRLEFQGPSLGVLHQGSLDAGQLAKVYPNLDTFYLHHLQLRKAGGFCALKNLRVLQLENTLACQDDAIKAVRQLTRHKKLETLAMSFPFPWPRQAGVNLINALPPTVKFLTLTGEFYCGFDRWTLPENITTLRISLHKTLYYNPSERSGRPPFTPQRLADGLLLVCKKHRATLKLLQFETHGYSILTISSMYGQSQSRHSSYVQSSGGIHAAYTTTSQRNMLIGLHVVFAKIVFTT